MRSAALAFAVGFALVFMVSYQTRQLAAGRKGVAVFVIACAISAAWCLGVRSIAASAETAPFYIFGAGCGTMVACRTKVK